MIYPEPSALDIDNALALVSRAVSPKPSDPQERVVWRQNMPSSTHILAASALLEYAANFIPWPEQTADGETIKPTSIDAGKIGDSSIGTETIRGATITICSHVWADWRSPTGTLMTLCANCGHVSRIHEAGRR